MEDFFEGVQITDNDLTALIKTSGNILRFAFISDLNKEEDVDMLATLIDNACITKDFDNIYNLMSPYLKKVHEDELKLDEKPKYNEKSKRLKKYKTVTQIKNILEKTNTDLIALKHYMIVNSDLEYSNEISIMCNYLFNVMDIIYKKKVKRENDLKGNSKF